MAARLTRDQKLVERCSVLAEVVKQLAPIYHAPEATETQRQLLETMIGAAIWYLPTWDGLWTGQVSLGAIRAFHASSNTQKPRLTADHEFPRKVAASELLNTVWYEVPDAAGEVLRRYREKYGRFNYITPLENRKLMRFQRSSAFSAVEKAYGEAGIVLVPTTTEELAQIKLRNQEVIEQLISQADHKVALQIVTE